MQKIYVLLRNEQQTGPYSLQEIIQFDLKPYDLIWIEGRSAGWYYPQEIAALHPYLSFLPKPQKPVAAASTAASPVFVAMPAAQTEPETIADLPKSSARNEAYSVVPEVRPATFTDSKKLEEEVYAQFTSKQEKKAAPVATASLLPKRRTTNPVAVGLLTVLIVGGVFAASWIMNRQPVAVNEMATSQPPTELPGQPVPANPTGPVATESKTKGPASKQVQGNRVALLQASTSQKAGSRSKATAVSTTASSQIPETNNRQVIAPDNEVAPPSTEAVEEPTAETTTTPKEEKKTLRDKFLDLFKKKPGEKQQGESRSAETENGERSSSRRENGANLEQMVHVRFDVPNDWMMGISGAKATLVNRSSETISKAVVEIQYFDDENNLLQKKNVLFSKVDGKGSRTVSIPDHPTATKVDYSVVSVTGKPAA